MAGLPIQFLPRSALMRCPVKVLELMKTHVIKTRADATMHDAVDMMDLYQISGLPVVDEEDRLVGIITEFDVIQALLPPYAEATEPYLSTDFHTLVERVKRKPVSESMTRSVISIDENADVVEAARLMLQHRIKRLPVTSEGRLVGIISRIDICQAILEGQISH
jgi:CBS domain-containing protein